MAHPKFPSISLQAGGGGSDSIFPVSELLALASPPVVTLRTFGCDTYPDSTLHTSFSSSPGGVQGENLDVTFWGPLTSTLRCLGIP